MGQPSVEKVEAFAPATVANVAIGYDVLGFSIDGPGDRVQACWSDEPGVVIESIEGPSEGLPYETELNTASKAALEVLKRIESSRGMRLKIHKGIRGGSGLGSSAASAVAGALAAHALAQGNLSRSELLLCAGIGESVASGAFHLDNVAPSMLGGLVLVASDERCECVSLPIPEGWQVVVVHPHIKVLTKEARSVLKDQITIDTWVTQSRSSMVAISALYEGDADRAGRYWNDVVIEPQRASLIPAFADLKEIAGDHRALSCSISGAGPSVFALCQTTTQAQRIQDGFLEVMRSQGIACDVYLSAMQSPGAQIQKITE